VSEPTTATPSLLLLLQRIPGRMKP